MASRTTTVLYDAVLQPTELSSSQFSALRNIHRFGPGGVAELAKIMLLERTTLTRNIELLEERGFARLSVSERDARVRRPELTDDGERKLKSAIPRWRIAQRRMLGGLGAQGWADLQKALREAAAINENAPERLYDFSEGPRVWDDDANPNIEPSEMQRCVNSTLRGASRFLTREYDAVLRPHGIKITQFHVLAAIDENAGLRITDLASLLSLDQASATLAIAGLRRIGWARMNEDRDVSDTGTPAKAIELTTAGRAVLAEAIEAWRACNGRKTGGGNEVALRWSAAIDKALTSALKAKMN